MDTNPGIDPASVSKSKSSAYHEIHVHGLTAKAYLNQPIEDLIPSRFLKKADKSPVVQRNAWIFRSGEEDARHKNLNRWSQIDIRYRGVFKTLQKVPKFKKGLYDGGECEVSAKKLKESARAQGQVIYALLDEIFGMMRVRRQTADDKSYFHLCPRLLSCQMEYWTGYRERYQDAPYTAGFISLDFCPEAATCDPVLPVSTTKTQESLQSSLEGKFKLILCQFLFHIHILHPPADRFPDQEIFLLGMHGSRLHIFRVYFPGQKTSHLWCGRHIPSKANLFTSSVVTGGAPPSSNDRFYTKQNIERVLEEVERIKLFTVDGDPDPRTFRLLGTKEYDLWVKSDFRAAVRALVALNFYLMSGEAKCGVLQKIFDRYPYHEESEPETEEQENARLLKIVRDQDDVVMQEQDLEKKEQMKRKEDQERFLARESMRASADDRISGFKNARQPWWDWVWDDGEPDADIGKDVGDMVFLGP